MCFSAPASFIASGGLMVLGGASLAVAKKEDKVLAAIPLMFGIQQAFEGVQWLYLYQGTSSLIAGYGFLFFAFVVWPIYVPTFVYILDKERRKILGWFIVLGTAVALYFLFLLATEPLFIRQLQNCVSYSFKFPFQDAANLSYVIAVFSPLFISKRNIFKLFGIAIAIMAIISWLFYTVTFASVWCFFAAIVSSMFFVYIRFGEHFKNGKLKPEQPITG